MNYDHLNLTFDYWLKIRSSLSTKLQVNSFDDYLKKLSFLKSYKWLRDMESIKIARPPLALDPEAFIKLYGNKCIAVHVPGRPEEGMMRAIFQISTTLHVEVSLMVWIENNKLNSYIALVICHRDDDELFEFLKIIKPLQRKGNTEERATGFHGHIPAGMDGNPFPP